MFQTGDQPSSGSPPPLPYSPCLLRNTAQPPREFFAHRKTLHLHQTEHLVEGNRALRELPDAYGHPNLEVQHIDAPFLEDHDGSAVVSSGLEQQLGFVPVRIEGLGDTTSEDEADKDQSSFQVVYPHSVEGPIFAGSLLPHSPQLEREICLRQASFSPVSIPWRFLLSNLPHADAEILRRASWGLSHYATVSLARRG